MEELLAAFGIPGEVLDTSSVAGGRIHGTYRVHTARGDYIMQRMNPQVFPHPEQVMENIAVVTSHIRRHFPAQTTLHFYQTPDGAYLRDGWRVMDCIPGKPLHGGQRPEVISAAGRAFGAFGNMLTGLDPSGLHEVLPGFHDTRARFAALRQAADSDPLGRLGGVRDMYMRLLALESAACILSDSGLPLRIIHGDTKLSNILFDDAGEPLAVIDLDTVSPGLAAYDYGDAVRSLHAGRERLDRALTGAFTRGFLEGAAHLTAQERETLPLGIICITAELAARYLTDHLTGDAYFHARDSRQRAAALLRLAEDAYGQTGRQNG